VRLLKVLIVVLIAAAAAWAWYPPFRLFTLVAVGRSAVCPLANALQTKSHGNELKRAKDRILAGSKLMREESGLELWDTPKGFFWIPKGNRFVLPFNLAEMELRVYFSPTHLIHPGDVVLDCGASDGDFTREALAAGASKVVSIEVSPASVECIRRNLAAEIAAGRVIVYPKGVWDKDDTLTLNVDDTNFAANSVVIRPNSSHPTIAVPLTTIDKIVAELKLPQVDFIKMDVEGAEVRAIEGARETIGKFKPRLSITAEHGLDDEFTIPAAVQRVRSDYQMECGPCLESQARIRADVLYFH
jgi:FkbM family methyltransferase